MRYKFGYIIAITFLLVTSLLRMKNNIIFDSDRLYFDEFYTNVWKQHGEISLWKLSPAPAYFPELIFYFIASFFFQEAKSRLLGASALEILLLLGATFYFLKSFKIKESNYKNLLTSMVVVGFLTVESSVTPIWFYISSGNTHMGAVICSLLAFTSIIKIKRKIRLHLNFPLLFFWTFLGIASSPVTFVAFVCPILLIETYKLICQQIKKKGYSRSSFLITIFMAVSSMFGLLSPRFLPFERSFGLRSRFSISDFRKSLKSFFDAIVYSYSPAHGFLLILSTIVSLSYLYLLAIFTRNRVYRIEQEENSENYVLNFTLLALPTNIILCLCSAGFSDNLSFRFCAFPITLTLIVALAIYLNGETLAERNRSAISVLSLLGIFACSLTSMIHSQYPGKAVASCIQQALKEHYPLRNGLGDYIDSRAVNYLLAPGHEVRAIESDLSPLNWTTTKDFSLDPPKYNEFFNYIVTRPDSHSGPFGITPEKMGGILASSTGNYDCQVEGIKLYYFNSNFLDSIFRSTAKRKFFPTKYDRKLLIDGSRLPTTNGKIVGTYVLSPEINSHTEIFSYGPYLNLPAGSYELIFNLDAKNSSLNSPCGFIQIGDFLDNPPQLVKKIDFRSTHGVQNVKIVFQLKRATNNVEMRTWVLPNCVLSVRYMNLEKIK